MPGFGNYELVEWSPRCEAPAEAKESTAAPAGPREGRLLRAVMLALAPFREAREAVVAALRPLEGAWSG